MDETFSLLENIEASGVHRGDSEEKSLNSLTVIESQSRVVGSDGTKVLACRSIDLGGFLLKKNLRVEFCKKTGKSCKF